MTLAFSGMGSPNAEVWNPVTGEINAVDLSEDG